MKAVILCSISALALCLGAVPARTQSFDDLSDFKPSAAADKAGNIPSPHAPAEAAAKKEEAGPETPTEEDTEFLVRPPAEHEPGFVPFDPTEASVYKSAVGGPSVPYLSLAQKESEAQGVDLHLILAMIQKESGFDRNARSSVGAIGLMQLMPGTARHMGLKDIKKLRQPAVNIKYGVKYLNYLANRFGKESLIKVSAADLRTDPVLRKVIAAYNAGPGNVEMHNGVPPFRETKDYMIKIELLLETYDLLLPDKNGPELKPSAALPG
jgi:soluble lytic murein transglycosylase-like protein